MILKLQDVTIFLVRVHTSGKSMVASLSIKRIPNRQQTKQCSTEKEN
jgi:hypothetical protein